jgi:hypothetical protein
LDDPNITLYQGRIAALLKLREDEERKLHQEEAGEEGEDELAPVELPEQEYEVN